MSLALFEQRVRELERRVGLSMEDGTAATTTSDLMGRVQRLEQRFQSIIQQPKQQPQSGTASSGGGSTLYSSWTESTKLLEELDPGTALTHQQQIAAPLLYRRQELLASSSSLRDDLDQLSTILSLLLIATSTSSDAKLTESQVTQAPILTQSTLACLDDADEGAARLLALAVGILELQQRADKASNRIDAILDQYSQLVLAISERTVELDKLLKSRNV